MVDFMSNIMNQAPFDTNLSDGNIGTLPDILDFSFDDPFQFSISDLLLPQFEGEQSTLAQSGTVTPSIQKLTSIGQQAFQDSMWLWTPSQTDNTTADQANLSLPTPELISREASDIEYHLSLASRDRVLSLILSTCEKSTQRRVVSCFPSAEMLSTLLSNFMTFHSHQVSPWIHLPTLDVNSEPEELLLALIAAGAVNSSFPNVRKLGYAMHEALRNGIAESFETDNRNTRDLRILQAYALMLQIGLWSGNRRKMEIAESFAYPLITMLRRGSRFRMDLCPDVAPILEDDQEVIEDKWKKWVEHESFKRLAYQLFLRDTGSSFALMTQPLISYTEVCLELPFSQELWQAADAAKWKQIYLSEGQGNDKDLPLLRSVLEDLDLIAGIQSDIDIQMSLAIIVSTIWSRVWQCLQLKTLTGQHPAGSTGSNMLTVSIYQQELVHAGKTISLRSTDWLGGLGPYASLLLELCMLHLHVSLEAVQILAGKNGEQEARKVMPVLRKWRDSAESRQAIFHAGQMLLATQKFPLGHLQDHSAIAVYHASLAVWAYAVLSEASLHSTDKAPQQSPRQNQDPVVLLDSEDGPEIQRFLVLGTGRPAIRKYHKNGDKAYFANDSVSHILLGDTLPAMNSIANLLASKNGDEGSRPPMVANLNKLMHALGKAAAEMKKKGP